MFKDRISDNPNRKKIKLEGALGAIPAGAEFYADIERADTVINGQEGTPLNAVNLHNELIGRESIKIPVGANLNDYTINGFYYNPTNKEVSTMTNVPVHLAFSLLVEKHAGVKQTLTTFQPYESKTFVRNFYHENGWGPWIKQYDEITTGCTKIFEYNSYASSNTWYEMNSAFKENYEYIFVLRAGQGTFLTTVSGIFFNWADCICTNQGYNGIYVEFNNNTATGAGRFQFAGTSAPHTLVKVFERKI